MTNEAFARVKIDALLAAQRRNHRVSNIQNEHRHKAHDISPHAPQPT